MASSSGTLQKLQIAAFSVDSDGTLSEQNVDEFEVALNPSGYTHSYTISYNDNQAQGTTGNDQKYAGTDPDTINFDIWLDGTGAAGSTNSTSKKDVKDQLSALKDVVYKYGGVDHEPNIVRLLWGSMLFFGRLQTMKVDYKLFQPSGEPLRAKVTLVFKGFVSKEEESLRANRSSPDLTHLVEVKAGDTLPLLCNRIYKDSSYYLAVAEFNGITHFRDIRPGQKLYFPPLA